MLESETDDSEAVYRAFVALGNVVSRYSVSYFPALQKDGRFTSIIKRTTIFLIARRSVTFCNASGLFLQDLRKIEFAIFLRRLSLCYESVILVL